MIMTSSEEQATEADKISNNSKADSHCINADVAVHSWSYEWLLKPSVIFWANKSKC